MTNMRNEIAAIVWLHKDYSQGYDAADAIMELVQAHIDEQVVWVQDLATELNNAEARIDTLEEVPEPVRIQRVHDLDRNGEFMGHHIITCNPDGTDATVTWEPIGGEY